MSSYKISVIICAYNHSKYLTKSIESIICQSFNSWKMIIINDGSTDQTYDILQQFKKKIKKKLKIINNKHNLGINNSLNLALKFVDTPFFIRQDADDISAPNRLELLYNEISKKENKKYSFIGSRMKSLINPKLIYPTFFIKRPIIDDFLKFLPFCNATLLFRSNVLNVVKNYNSDDKYNKRFEDYEMIYRCYKHGLSGMNIDQITYYVNQDLFYFKKILPYERLIEFKLKLEIFKNNKSFNISNLIYIFLPILKIPFYYFFFMKEKIFRK